MCCFGFIDIFFMYLIVALSPLETIGSFGVRNFMLCKKPRPVEEDGDGKQVTAGITRKNSGSWKSWFNKSLNLKVSSHWTLDWCKIFQNLICFRSSMFWEFEFVSQSNKSFGFLNCSFLIMDFYWNKISCYNENFLVLESLSLAVNWLCPCWNKARMCGYLRSSTIIWSYKTHLIMFSMVFCFKFLVAVALCITW